MRSLSSVAFLAVSMVILTSGNGRAQQAFGPRIPQYGPGYRPGLSPYLNLLRGGDTASNYFIGVRPEIQRRADRDNLYSRTKELDNRTQELEREEDEITSGTPSDFGDTKGYFASPNTYFQRAGPTGGNQLARPLGRPRSK